jgi:electron transfer flavoprotein alpha subunit
MARFPGPVWVVAEQTEGCLLTVSLQIVGRARILADQLGVPAEAILLGCQAENAARQLIAAGADRVYLGNAPHLAIYQPEAYIQLITDLAREHEPDILILGLTSMGRELAPLVAARLETGLTARCVDLTLAPNSILEQKVPAYGGLISIVCPERRPQMATVARGVFPNPQLDESRRGEIVRLHVPNASFKRVETLGIVCEEPKGVSLEAAQIVVAGGAGVGDAAGWQSVVELADVLGAGLGSTRPCVDEGWTRLETMIGQSDKTISPALYIGVALSGEQQHMVGIAGAQMMVAINNDEKAPVFEQVDLGIVDDCREFVPALIERIRELKSKRNI